MAALENQFTWSISRHGSFEYCPRQYWWSYYGSWGGWSRDADPLARRAYMLKNLSTRHAWVGTVVHEAVEQVLRRRARGAQSGRLDFEGTEGRTPDVAAELDRATERMRADWLSSRDGRYRDQPKKAFGLVEHEYQEPISRAEWAAQNEKARTALEGLLRSDLFAELLDSDPASWLPIEQLDSFAVDGVPVWVVLDFARRAEDGTLHIYDWKTGRFDPQGNKAQLGCYTIYVAERHGADADRVVNHLVYLADAPREVAFRLGPADLDAAHAFVRGSIAALRARLVDPLHNVARRDDFPLTDDFARCAGCAYRGLCGRT